MARRKASRRTARDRADAGQAMRDSAQSIWLAGLGAFERAKTEGPRVFEALVEQGRNMGARAVGMADQALRTMRESESAGRFDKLEKLFEERLAASLKRLGVLTTGQVDDLARQVRELNERLQDYGRPPRSKARRAKAGAARKGRGKAAPRSAPRSKRSKAKRARS
jgi:poly(hydroxyalkanoate) granule-associated protein